MAEETHENLLRDPIGFWDRRHRSVDEWRSGGDRGLDVSRNKAFYAHRLGLLVGILDTYLFDDLLRILDAGCGKGWLTDQLSAFGHDVTGIDSSERAVEICRENRMGRFERAALDEFRDAFGFDAVIAMDVLFHILDDDLWARSVATLAGAVRWPGLLIIADFPGEDRQVLGDYIVHRPLTQYREVLAPHGLQYVAKVPYSFAANDNAFLVFGFEEN